MFKKIINRDTFIAVSAFLATLGFFSGSAEAHAEDINPVIRSSQTSIVHTEEKARQTLEEMVKAEGGVVIEENESSFSVAASDFTNKLISDGVNFIVDGVDSLYNGFTGLFRSNDAQTQDVNITVNPQNQPQDITSASMDEPLPDPSTGFSIDSRSPGQLTRDTMQDAAGNIYRFGRDIQQGLENVAGEGVGNLIGGLGRAGTGVAGLTVEGIGYAAGAATDAFNYVFGSNNNEQQNVTVNAQPPQQEQVATVTPQPQPEQQVATAQPEQQPTITVDQQEVPTNVRISDAVTGIVGDATNLVVEGVNSAYNGITGLFKTNNDNVKNVTISIDKRNEQQQEQVAATQPAPEKTETLDKEKEVPTSVKISDFTTKTVGDTVNFVVGGVNSVKNGITGLFNSNEKQPDITVTAPETKETVPLGPPPRALTAAEQESGITNNAEFTYNQEFNRTDNIQVAGQQSNKDWSVDISDKTAEIVGTINNNVVNAADKVIDATGNAFNDVKDFIVKDIPDGFTKVADTIIPSKEQIAKLNPFGSKDKELSKEEQMRQDLLAQGFSEEEIENALLRADLYAPEMNQEDDGIMEIRSDQITINDSPTVEKLTSGYPENKENFGEIFARKVDEHKQMFDAKTKEALGDDLGDLVGVIPNAAAMTVSAGSRLVGKGVDLGVEGISSAYDSTKDFVADFYDKNIPTKEQVAEFFGVKKQEEPTKVAEVKNEEIQPVSEFEKFLADKGLSPEDIKTAFNLATGNNVKETEKTVEKEPSSLKNTLASAQGVEVGKDTYSLSDKDTSNISITVNGMINNQR